MASGRHAMFQTGDEKFQRLLKCLEPLRENKVQVDTESELLFVSPCQLLVRLFQVLTTIPYKEVRDSVLAKANSLGICPLSYEMNLRHIYEVCLWMRTKAGIDAVIEVQRSEKLKRRAAEKKRKIAEAAIIKAFKAQFSEYRTELKEANVVLEDRDTVLRLQSKYWPVSAFDIATNVLPKEEVLDFCRKGVKCGLYKYVEGLIERYKMESFALCAADNIRTILKEIDCFEVLKDENCHVGEKRKGSELVLGHEGEKSYRKVLLYQKTH